MPRFSIEIPHFNRPILLQRAVASCVSQTYRDFEVLICDDGSPKSLLLDNILSDLDSLPFVRIYRNHINLGVSYSRNMLWDRSASSIHSFLDSDDLMHPLRLERQFVDIETKKTLSGKKFIISSTDYATFLLSTNKLIDRIQYRRGNCCIKQDLYLTQPVAFGSMAIYSRDEVSSPFDPTSRACEDYQFLASVIDESDFFHIQQLSTYVALHQNSLSTNPLTRAAQINTHDKVIFSLWSKYFELGQLHARQLRKLFVTEDAIYDSIFCSELLAILESPKVSFDKIPREMLSVSSLLAIRLKSMLSLEH